MSRLKTVAVAGGLILQVSSEILAGPAAGTNPNPGPVWALPVIDESEEGGVKQGTYVSPWIAEVTKLVQSGIEDDVIITYICNCAGTFNLGAEGVIEMTKAGVSAQVIASMLQHDQEIISGQRQVTPSTARLPSESSYFSKMPRPPAQPSPAPVEIPAASQSSGEAPPEPAVSYVASATAASPAAEPKAPRYPVRAPYPEKLTTPILILSPAADRAPNVVVIEYLR